MKATRKQVTEMLVQTGLIEPGCWLVDGNKYEALVHLAQQFTLDQLRAQGVGAKVISSGAWDFPCLQWLSANDSLSCNIGDKLYRIPETLE